MHLVRNVRTDRQDQSWSGLRTSPQQRDQTLSALALAWLETLPAEHYPDSLCLAYPRLANRIALCWPEWQLTEILFEELLVDKRGGRAGFPQPVRTDLLNLRRWSAARVSPDTVGAFWTKRLGGDKWDLHLQSPSDRVGRSVETRK
jgi:hypothetical protein